MRACGINYTDIDSDEWYVYQGYLKYVTQHKLLTGYSGTTLFGPHDDTTERRWSLSFIGLLAQKNRQMTLRITERTKPHLLTARITNGTQMQLIGQRITIFSEGTLLQIIRLQDLMIALAERN